MIFGVVILLLALAVAYFHYAQGFFSATLSAIFTVIAAVVAVSYHETVVAVLLKGAVANIAESVTLVILFVATYAILRGIFDKTIPGNVRYPLLVDKIGAGIVGLIAGLFATGVLAIAAQALPFGPSIAQFSRYTVLNRDVILPGGSGAMQDSVTQDEMKDTSFDPKNENKLFLPVDDMLVGTVDHLSTGALDNGNPLASIHPNWMTELFGQRVGVQVGSKRVALNLPGLENTHLTDVFKMDSVLEIDAEHKSVREGANHDQQTLAPDKGDTLDAKKDGKILLVVRVNMTSNATDEDNKVRFSCASVRMVGWHDSSGTKVYTDYTPVGTLEDAFVLFRNKADDPLVAQGGKSVDFVFEVPPDDVFKEADPKAPQQEVKKGVFIEVKRMAQMDMSDQVVKGPPVFSKDVEVTRKTLEQAKRFPKRSASGDATPQVTATGPLTITEMKLGNTLFTKINPGAYQGDVGQASFKAGNAVINHKQFQKLEINPSETLAEMAVGDFAMDAMYVPPGKKMIQVAGKPASGVDPWQWANPGDFALVDSDQNQYHPNGAFAQLNKDGGAPCMVGNYDADNGNPGIPHGGDDGRPMMGYLYFLVPEKIEITQLQYKGETIKAQDIKVH